MEGAEVARYDAGAAAYVEDFGGVLKGGVDDAVFHELGVAGGLVVEAGVLGGARIVSCGGGWDGWWVGLRLVAYLFLGRLYSTSLVSVAVAASLMGSDIVVVYLVKRCFLGCCSRATEKQVEVGFLESSLITYLISFPIRLPIRSDSYEAKTANTVRLLW